MYVPGQPATFVRHISGVKRRLLCPFNNPFSFEFLILLFSHDRQASFPLKHIFVTFMSAQAQTTPSNKRTLSDDDDDDSLLL
jgi:hypothetical protein